MELDKKHFGYDKGSLVTIIGIIILALFVLILIIGVIFKLMTPRYEDILLVMAGIGSFNTILGLFLMEDDK